MGRSAEGFGGTSLNTDPRMRKVYVSSVGELLNACRKYKNTMIVWREKA